MPRAAFAFVTSLLAVSTLASIGCRSQSPQENAQSVAKESESSPTIGHDGPAAEPSDFEPDQVDPSSVHRSTDPTASSLKGFPEGFVGTATCARCHQPQYESYLKTHHSRSLRPASADDSVSGKAFDHPKSQRSYRIVKNGEQTFHHEERYFGASPLTNERIVTGHYPVEFVMGSGAFAKAYLVRDGDYLLQSPITWYAGAKEFEIAPGYDSPNQVGFRRVVTEGCMFCHAGIVSTENENPNRFAVHEHAIGCERCHGAGQQHANLYQSVSQTATPIETSQSAIFNPRDSDRVLSEAVCAQCHLDGDVTVFATSVADGSNPGDKDVQSYHIGHWDFRPGDDLGRLRTDYKGVGDLANDKTFSNHFDQMWKSDCYIQSTTLTCITCHDPHGGAIPEDKVSHFRKLCLDCHGDIDCEVPHDRRVERNANDCADCHMPHRPSDVPHTSTTNHRIAVYRDDDSSDTTTGLTADSETNIRVLRRVDAANELGDDEQRRRDQLAKAKLAILKVFEGNDQPILSIDTHQLTESLSDLPPHHAIIAKAAFRRGQALQRSQDASPDEIKREFNRAHHFAVKALREIQSPTLQRQELLELLADKRMTDEAFGEAVALYEELVRIRRDPRDWFNLALCYAQQKRIADAEAALQRAIRMDPAYAKPYGSLAKIYMHLDVSMAQQYDALFRLLDRKP